MVARKRRPSSLPTPISLDPRWGRETWSPAARWVFVQRRSRPVPVERKRWTPSKLAVIVPVHDVEAMDDRQRVVNQVGKPLTLAGVSGRYVPAQEWLRRFEPGKRRSDFVVRLLCTIAQQGNIHQPQAAAPIQVRPAQAV